MSEKLAEIDQWPTPISVNCDMRRYDAGSLARNASINAISSFIRVLYSPESV